MKLIDIYNAYPGFMNFFMMYGGKLVATPGSRGYGKVFTITTEIKSCPVVSVSCFYQGALIQCPVGMTTNSAGNYVFTIQVPNGNTAYYYIMGMKNLDAENSDNGAEISMASQTEMNFSNTHDHDGTDSERVEVMSLKATGLYNKLIGTDAVGNIVAIDPPVEQPGAFAILTAEGVAISTNPLAPQLISFSNMGALTVDSEDSASAAAYFYEIWKRDAGDGEGQNWTFVDGAGLAASNFETDISASVASGDLLKVMMSAQHASGGIRYANSPAYIQVTDPE